MEGNRRGRVWIAVGLTVVLSGLGYVLYNFEVEEVNEKMQGVIRENAAKVADMGFWGIGDRLDYLDNESEVDQGNGD